MNNDEQPMSEKSVEKNAIAKSNAKSKRSSKKLKRDQTQLVKVPARIEDSDSELVERDKTPEPQKKKQLKEAKTKADVTIDTRIPLQKMKSKLKTPSQAKLRS